MRLQKTLRIAVPLVVTGVLITGCTATSDTTPASSASAGATSAPAAKDYTNFSPYFPVRLGNTWVYSTDFGGAMGVVTDTEKMTKIVPSGTDLRVTFSRSFHYENASHADFDSPVDYVFHQDGSLSVPYQSIPTGGAQVTVKGDGSMLWPSVAEFEAGTPKTGTIEVSAAVNGTTTEETVDFAIAGAGTESVTVPAGTYSARKLSQKLTVAIPSLGVTGIEVDATTWLAKGVGNVRTEVPGLLGTQAIVAQLVKFTPGKS
jgi:hypothetical protein